jgi:hypothetical protein
MARPLQIQIVERARALIADQQHWCRGDLARDINGEEVSSTAASAVKRCGLGAVIAAAHELTHDLGVAHDFAFKALRPQYGTATLVRVNDMRGMQPCFRCSMKSSQRILDWMAAESLRRLSVSPHARLHALPALPPAQR